MAVRRAPAGAASTRGRNPVGLVGKNTGSSRVESDDLERRVVVAMALAALVTAIEI